MSKDDPLVHFEGQDMPVSHWLQLVDSRAAATNVMRTPVEDLTWAIGALEGLWGKLAKHPDCERANFDMDVSDIIRVLEGVIQTLSAVQGNAHDH
jgi:hypothetical protein